MGRTPVLKADLVDVYGSVSFPPAWNELDAITRADLLKDWLVELEQAYNGAVAGIFGDKE